MAFLRSLFFLSVLVCVSCQTPATKLREEREARSKATEEVLAKNIILLDARPPFVVATSPIAQATPLQWRDFVVRQPPFENALEPDLFFHARRLARLGIGPDTPVIVLGRGQSGDGEEGRLAWTLRYLGVKDVKFMSSEQFRFAPQWMASPERPAAPLWKPEIQGDLIIPPQELKKKLKSDSDLLVVELRDSGGSRLTTKQLGSHLRKEISWKELSALSAEKRTARLQSLLEGIQAPIAVVDGDGVKAASVTLWLRDAGFRASCLCVGLIATYRP